MKIQRSSLNERYTRDVASRPPTLPSPRQAILVWLLGIFLVLGAGLLLGLIAVAVARSEGLTLEAAFALIADPVASPLVASPSWISLNIILNEVIVFVLLVLWRRRLGSPLGAIMPLSLPSPRALLGAILLPFGLAPIAEVVAKLVQRALPFGLGPDHFVTVVSRGTSPLLFVLVLCSVALLPAIMEELMFRGFVTSAFSRFSPFVKLLVPSVMFGLFHPEPTLAAGTMVLGIAFGLVRLYTGSIWACIISHCSYNAGIICEARFLAGPQEQISSWHRVGLGLALALLAYALLVGVLGRRILARFNLPPGRRS